MMLFDIRPIINRKTVASEFRRGIVTRLGPAVNEKMIFDTQYSRVIDPSLVEHHVPAHADVPQTDLLWLKNPGPLTPLEGMSVSEVNLVGAPAAVADTVNNATNERTGKMQLTRVVELLEPVKPLSAVLFK
jgi:xanthine dehydrogenase YagR molybdenum-binding subunit